MKLPLEVKRTGIWASWDAFGAVGLGLTKGLPAFSVTQVSPSQKTELAFSAYFPAEVRHWDVCEEQIDGAVPHWGRDHDVRGDAGGEKEAAEDDRDDLVAAGGDEHGGEYADERPHGVGEERHGEIDRLQQVDGRGDAFQAVSVEAGRRRHDSVAGGDDRHVYDVSKDQADYDGQYISNDCHC